MSSGKARPYVQYARITVTDNESSGSPFPLIQTLQRKAEEIVDVHLYLIPSFAGGPLEALASRIREWASDTRAGRVDPIHPQLMDAWASDIEQFLAEAGDNEKFAMNELVLFRRAGKYYIHRNRPKRVAGGTQWVKSEYEYKTLKGAVRRLKAEFENARCPVTIATDVLLEIVEAL